MNSHSTREARLFVDRDMDVGQVAGIAGGQAVVYSSRSPGKQTANEDAAAVIPFGDQAGLLVIADGLGGLRAGEQASSMALEELRSALGRARAAGHELRAAILNGIEKANRKISDLALGTATTLALVEIQNRTVRPYHVGDSMVMVAGQRGKIKLQTISHSPIGYAVESGLLDEREAMHHDERHLVSNIVGTADMRIEIGSSVKLAARDTLIVASDGLFDNLHVDEIVQRIRKGPLEQVAQALAQQCHHRMRKPDNGKPSKPDDLTFIVYRAGPSRAPRR